MEESIESIEARNIEFQKEIKEAYDQQEEKEALKADANKTPLFPYNGLHTTMEGIINDCAAIYGTHPDLWAAAVISAVSTAIGNSIQLKTKYTNSPLLWLVPIAPSGAGKTQPGSFAFAPLHALDMEQIKEHVQAQAEYDAIAAMPKKERLTELVPPPPPKQSILSDATPEAIVSALHANPRGVCVNRDELHGFLLDVGRYNKSGELQNWLSAWSEQSMTINRKGAGPMKIERPFINIYGGIQPGLLPELAKDGKAVNGFLHRLCFFFPDESTKPNYTSATLPPELISKYTDIIHRLISRTGQQYLYLSGGADAVYQKWFNVNAAFVNANPNSPLSEAYNKLDIIVLRLCVIIHGIDLACAGIDSNQITSFTMQAAINMTEYFRATAKKVHKQLSAGAAQGFDVKQVAKWMQGRGASLQNIADGLKVSRSTVQYYLK